MPELVILTGYKSQCNNAPYRPETLGSVDAALLSGCNTSLGTSWYVDNLA